MFNFNEMKYLAGIPINEIKKSIAWSLQREMFHLALRDIEHLVILLFKDHQPVKKMERKEISVGNIESVAFDIYDIIRAAKKYGADEVNILHNHPSGNATPSKTDLQVAKEMNEIFKNYGLTARYFVVGANNPKSLIDLNFTEYDENGIIDYD